ncbi:MAG TPA: 3-phosphoshikimate 1-carboxyvinyltransferase [Solirubrobacterales bacterium]|jgi:3-phosphoshikimate 1-carboxyvinyltransferase|nr:3-phosphoshikimate 1-carboxyvinyltransferase [Solirubrobacterales bacterium]
MSSTRFAPSGRLYGWLRPPADKSISHRAALIAAMGEEEVLIDGYLDAADTRSTLQAVEALGAQTEAVTRDVWMAMGLPDGWDGPPLDLHGTPDLSVRVRGVGLRKVGPAEIDVGNAGTLLRLLPGWLAGQEDGRWTLDGDDSIRRRPVDRIAVPLREMGADLSAREDRLPPLEVHGAPLQGITYEMPIASAQVKSCVLLAGLLAEGGTRVIEPSPSRDHTERMLMAAGATVRREGNSVAIRPVERLSPGPLVVPADISSAAFFIVASLLVPDSDVVLAGVGVNPTRTGLLTILERMGASVEQFMELNEGGEPIATLRVRPAPLQATEVGGAEIPLAIDELPLVALAACFAEGTTTIRDAEELRRKESDRIETVTAALRALGGHVEPTEDGMVIEGTGGLRGGTIDSHGDHRIAMLGAVAGLASKEGVEVVGMDAAAVSYPGFESDLRSLLAS